MNKPTDAEIIALNAGEIHFSESPTKYPEAGHGTQYHAGAHGVLSFARAVLAKWGTPAPVGVEPVARLEIGKTKGGVSLTHIAEPAAFQLPEGMYALYTTPQPVEREPLTDEQIHAIYDAVARREPYAGAVTRRSIVRAIEAEVRKGDTELIRQLVESMCWAARVMTISEDEAPGYFAAITAARARLEEKP